MGCMETNAQQHKITMHDLNLYDRACVSFVYCVFHLFCYLRLSVLVKTTFLVLVLFNLFNFILGLGFVCQSRFEN